MTCTHDCNQGRQCTCRDDADRRDLNGGLGVIVWLVASLAAFAGWLIWRMV